MIWQFFPKKRIRQYRDYKGLNDTAVRKIDIYSFENESGFTSGKEKSSYINYKKEK